MFLLCETGKYRQKGYKRALTNMDFVSHWKKKGNKIIVFYKDGRKETFDKVALSKKADLSDWFKLV